MVPLKLSRVLALHSPLTLAHNGVNTVGSGPRGRLSRHIRKSISSCPSAQLAIGRKMTSTPKDVHILIPRVSEYVLLHDKRDFAGVITVRILRREAYPGLSGTTGSL